ncbi:hypothetical protein [Pseudomonas typographi]|uniref:hypothetical protein n=1 Tax=Pseudomonas typographi TaxID=2715964 RepID=UPI001685ADBC|nr:hypothetical protein [Pseudomonas typographi]MBD1590333.1 hypothetical protein [Pseudomonas typographi]
MNDEHSLMACSSISQHAADCFQTIWDHAIQPSVLYRPKLSIDGNQWCALYGDNMHDGVAGFGDTPELAMHDFNKNWHRPLRNSPKGLALAEAERAKS